jgi:hypothetical protein
MAVVRDFGESRPSDASGAKSAGDCTSTRTITSGHAAKAFYRKIRKACCCGETAFRGQARIS